MDINDQLFPDCPKCLEKAREALGVSSHLFLKLLDQIRLDGSIGTNGTQRKIGQLTPVYEGLTGTKAREIISYNCSEGHVQSKKDYRYPAFFEWL